MSYSPRKKEQDHSLAKYIFIYKLDKALHKSNIWAMVHWICIRPLMHKTFLFNWRLEKKSMISLYRLTDFISPFPVRKAFPEGKSKATGHFKFCLHPCNLREKFCVSLDPSSHQVRSAAWPQQAEQAWRTPCQRKPLQATLTDKVLEDDKRMVIIFVLHSFFFSKSQLGANKCSIYSPILCYIQSFICFTFYC